MVMLLATVALMGFAIQTSAPYVFWETQREAEAEAIFRGESIAKAIKLYNAKHNRFPMKLEELMEQKPPILRRLYKDPLTREGDWDLIGQVESPTGNMTGIPIVGVKSKSIKDSIKLYKGKSLHCEWQFRGDGKEDMEIPINPGTPQPPFPFPNQGLQRPQRPRPNS